jgi:hypothetical protein
MLNRVKHLFREAVVDWRYAGSRFFAPAQNDKKRGIIVCPVRPLGSVTR